MSSKLHPLKIGSLTIVNNLLQAPLAGYSTLPFRLLAWRWGRPGLLATEMISTRALALGAPRQERYLVRSAEEGALCFQLWGAEPEDAAAATRIVDERGADVIDLNCGCPVRKVRAAGAGSKLMEDPPRIGRIVAAMRRSTEKPVTVKIRVGTRRGLYNGAEVARVAESEGADLVTVHGRHAGESYNTPCRVEQIAEVVQAVSIPVIGNGDVIDGPSARRLLEDAGCDGVMVGRGCMGAPWVFDRIRKELAGEAYSPPTAGQVGLVLLEHHDMLVPLLGPDLAIRHCRKLGSFYSKKQFGGRRFREKLNDCKTRDELKHLLEETFADRPGR